MQIPAQWQRFMLYYNAIPAKLDSIPVGLAGAVDDEGRFSYTCGVEVARFGEVPSALPSMGRTLADAPVIERHNPQFDPRTGEGGIALWVPLE